MNFRALIIFTHCQIIFSKSSNTFCPSFDVQDKVFRVNLTQFGEACSGQISVYWRRLKTNKIIKQNSTLINPAPHRHNQTSQDRMKNTRQNKITLRFVFFCRERSPTKHWDKQFFRATQGPLIVVLSFGRYAQSRVEKCRLNKRFCRRNRLRDLHSRVYCDAE